MYNVLYIYINVPYTTRCDSHDNDILEIKYSNSHKIQESILHLFASSVNTHKFICFNLLNNSWSSERKKGSFIKGFSFRKRQILFF